MVVTASSAAAAAVHAIIAVRDFGNAGRRARGRQRFFGEAGLQAREQMGRQLETVQRERGGLDALEISDQRTACRAALDVPFELALSRGIERAVDELGNRFA